MLDLVALIVATIAVSLLTFYVIILKLRIRKTATELIQAVLDKNLLQDRLSKILSDKKIKDIEKSDGFLKFISESRDAAFTYIEDVQAAIEAYSKAIEDGSESDILTSRERLFGFLPTNNLEK